MEFKQELVTIAPSAFSETRRRFLCSFVDDEEFIQFAMSSTYNGRRKENFFHDGSGLIWEHFSPHKRSICNRTKALQYLNALGRREIMMLTDAINGRIADENSPVFLVSRDLIQEISDTYPFFWNLYLFDNTYQWYVAITDENIGDSGETLSFAYGIDQIMQDSKEKS